MDTDLVDYFDTAFSPFYGWFADLLVVALGIAALLLVVRQGWRIICWFIDNDGGGQYEYGLSLSPGDGDYSGSYAEERDYWDDEERRAERDADRRET